MHFYWLDIYQLMPFSKRKSVCSLWRKTALGGLYCWVGASTVFKCKFAHHTSSCSGEKPRTSRGAFPLCRHFFPCILLHYWDGRTIQERERAAVEEGVSAAHLALGMMAQYLPSCHVWRHLERSTQGRHMKPGSSIVPMTLNKLL